MLVPASIFVRTLPTQVLPRAASDTDASRTVSVETWLERVRKFFQAFTGTGRETQSRGGVSGHVGRSNEPANLVTVQLSQVHVSTTEWIPTGLPRIHRSIHGRIFAHTAAKNLLHRTII